MKNYTYRYVINGMGYVPKQNSAYTVVQKNKLNFITKLSDIVSATNCGWSGVYYAVMERNGDEREYMVLHDETFMSERWIPIDGNSNACNFAVLGENLF